MKNNFWTEKENKIILDLFDRKQNLSYKKIQTTLYKATGVERSYISIWHQLNKLGLCFMNNKNNNLKNDYYHISEFRKYNFGTIRIKQILQEAGIKVYYRGRYYMVHCDDMEKAEKIIKNYIKKNSRNLKKHFITKKFLYQKYFLSSYELDKIIENGIITPDLVVKNCHCFSKEQEIKLKEYLDSLGSEYYSARELSFILDVNYTSIFDLTKKHKIKETTSSKTILFKKSDCLDLIKHKEFIINECVWIQDVINEVKYAEAHVRKLLKKNGIVVHKWKNKSFVKKEDFELLVNIITKNK